MIYIAEIIFAKAIIQFLLPRCWRWPLPLAKKGSYTSYSLVSLSNFKLAY